MSNYLFGIGKHRLIIRAGNSVIFDYTFPYCPFRGFKPEYRTDYYKYDMVNLDVNNPVITRQYFVTGFWGSWQLDWSGFPIDAEPGMKAIEFINKSIGDERMGVLEILFQPNTDNNLWFSVNNTFETIEPVPSKAAEDAAGTLGIKLRLEVKQMLTGIPPGSSSGVMNFTHISNESIKFVI